MIPIDGPVREGIGLLGSPSFEIPRSVQRDAAFDELKTAEELATRLPAKNRHNGLTLAMFLMLQWAYAFIALWIGSITLTWFEQVRRTGCRGRLDAHRHAHGGHRHRRRTHLPARATSWCPASAPSTTTHFWYHERFWKFAAGGYLGAFNGTPFKPFIWRFLGVRVGKRLFDDGCANPGKDTGQPRR